MNLDITLTRKLSTVDEGGADVWVDAKDVVDLMPYADLIANGARRLGVTPVEFCRMAVLDYGSRCALAEVEA